MARKSQLFAATPEIFNEKHVLTLLLGQGIKKDLRPEGFKS